MRRFLLFISVLLIPFSCSHPTDYKKVAKNPQILHRSVKAITDVIVHDIFSPPVASRIYAYISVAAYETARHQDSTLLTLAGQLHGLDPVPQPDPHLEYCFPLASIQAVILTGKAFIFSEDDLDVFYKTALKEFSSMNIPKDVYERSINYGTVVADHIIKWSSKDNYKQTRSFPKYSLKKDPATWIPTAPAYMDAIEPHWNKIRTFIIDSASQFKPGPPPVFSTDKNSEFYKYALEVYDVGIHLTDDQRASASFWDCNPFVMNVMGHVSFATKKISPGGHWMNITNVACVTARKDFAHSAEAYARVAISLADAFIACWDEKYRSVLIRPESYINLYIDKNWVPLLQTPPFPEYTSGHSVISSASAYILTDLFGPNFSFKDSTELEFGLPARKFTSFFQASDQAALSRLYGGIHYRPANERGVLMGRQVAVFIVEKLKTSTKKK